VARDHPVAEDHGLDGVEPGHAALRIGGEEQQVGALAALDPAVVGCVSLPEVRCAIASVIIRGGEPVVDRSIALLDRSR
jgi:hypothetical protein